MPAEEPLVYDNLDDFGSTEKGICLLCLKFNEI